VLFLGAEMLTEETLTEETTVITVMEPGIITEAEELLVEEIL